MKEITRIVLTGGPCAGKTTFLDWLEEEFAPKGYTVLLAREVATELVEGGIRAEVFAKDGDKKFQKYLLQMQLDRERLYDQAAQDISSEEKVLIFYDRGAIDGKAYMPEEDFLEILSQAGLSEVDARDHYDAVIHLETLAKGSDNLYSTENNIARKETPEEAIAVDDRLLAAWTGHPHLRVVENPKETGNSKVSEYLKYMHLLKEICDVLGEPEPLEIERKYLIRYPNLDWLESQPHCQRVEIVQTYLNSDDDDEVRVRQRGIDGNYVYFKTSKKKHSDMTRIEREERITEKEYLDCLMDVDITRHPIRKTRYCLMYENRYLEIDVYPFWDDRAILELELGSETDPVVVPKELEIIREVTDDPYYKNANLAKIWKDES